MSKTLTKKQRKFVNEYADSGNGTQAVIKAKYKVKNAKVAGVIAVENLAKPSIQNELEILGFNENTAKRVVSEILTDDTIEPQHRLKASEQVFKVQGSYAPEKNINLNLDAELTKNEGGLAEVLSELFS
jgi:phage terminase small subunit